ncbi:VOC family protein [Roseibium algae]|uniref:VOC family protein n=1 Tax=Roseibium algae TaxID=3123038 RepID=A0ABU8TJ84_9HYPH
MQTDALTLAEKTAEMGHSERLSWGVVEFQVTDLHRAVAFWTTALGLQLREQDSQMAALGTQSKTLFVFRSGAKVPVSPRHLGMYHVAIGVPDQAEFSRLLARLITKRVRVSPTDHLMSKAIYLADPDGLEIEIALETPERFGRFGDMSKGLVLYDANGQQHSGRAPLDVDAELSHAKRADLETPLSNGAFLAHMHFKVAQLEAAAAWYEGIGFARNLMLHNWGFADMGAGAAYTHRLAMNIWAGPNLKPAPANMARLTGYALHVHDAAVMENAQGLTPSENGLSGTDPTGVAISLARAF